MTDLLTNDPGTVNAYQLLGQAQAISAISNICDVTLLKLITEVKETKGFKGLSVTGPDGKGVTVTTFKEFCTIGLGRSYEQVNEDLKNLQQFGADAFEAFQKLGLGYRELRNMRRLPDDKILKIQDQVVNVDDKTEIRELLMDLVNENTKAKKELEKSERQTKKTTALLENELNEKELKRRQDLNKQTCPWPEPVMKAREECGVSTLIAISALDDIDLNMAELQDALPSLSKGNKGKAEFGAAASSIGLNLSMLLARLSQTIATANELGLGDYIETPDTTAALLTEQESSDIRTRWNVATQEQDFQKKVRQATRDEKTSRGKAGRPKGSKNKAK